MRAQAPGFPRYKSLSRFPGFSFRSHGEGWHFKPGTDWRHGILRLQGIGHVKARGQVRQGGDVCASDVLHRDGQWFLSLTLDIGQPQRERTADAALGFDWGVETFLTGVDHAGKAIRLDNQRWWQAVSRKKNRRSNRRRKAVRRLAAACAKSARRRLDWAHQQTASLARQYALVATEELRIARITRGAAGTIEEPGKTSLRKRA